ncbi:ankyrin repeat domain-containing protein [Acerihabitans sp. TG2]|uniref:ankyrin repeat domain-containing protein n=1 Tax=Acerihabitans sp. TG2 TaxID=3096008 RepID=UPI002B22BC69|nr:ankyrin repeat domain-containing protein [Acerihabitans sp. TG2]MEA9391814.1 ankyrin repeat domain-containing protein [Acerihabitans sp. TG2]
MIGEMRFGAVNNITTTKGIYTRDNFTHASFNRWGVQQESLNDSLRYVRNSLSKYVVFQEINHVEHDDTQREPIQKSLIYAGQPQGRRGKRQLGDLPISPEKSGDTLKQQTADNTGHRHRHGHGVKDPDGMTSGSSAADVCASVARKNEKFENNNIAIDTTLYQGRTLLTKAAMKGCVAELTKLITSGANPYVVSTSDHNRTPLIYAAKNGHSEVVDILLTFYQAFGDIKGIRYADSTGMSALMYARKNNHQSIYLKLFSAGQHARSDRPAVDHQFPLWAGVTNGLRPKRKLAVSSTDLRLANREDRVKKALEPASRDNPEIGVDSLLGNLGRISITPINPEDNIAILHATQRDDISAIEALLAQGADINAVDDEGKTALMWSSQRGALQIVETLLERGANVAIKDHVNKTALHYAIESGHTPVEGLIMQYMPINSATATQSTFATHAFRWLRRVLPFG